MGKNAHFAQLYIIISVSCSAGIIRSDWFFVKTKETFDKMKNYVYKHEVAQESNQTAMEFKKDSQPHHAANIWYVLFDNKLIRYF
jgi:hypothetical protein